MKKSKVKEELKEKLRQAKANKVKTIVSFILDKSGSMQDMKPAVISGFNEYVDSMRKNNDVFFSFTLFDSSEIENRYIVEPIKTVAPLTDDSYIPNAMTPLYDAICSSVKDTAKKLEEDGKKYASLVVIMTDGMENSSTQYNLQDFLKLKKELEAKGNWTFVFMGANQDAWATAAQWGISRGNTLNWQASNAGYSSAMKSLSNATVNYAVSMSASASDEQLNTNAFFSGTKKGKNN